MKVILIKDCKDGKQNTIIEVSGGYGTNFLIKKGFAVPYNEQTLSQLNKRLDTLSADEHENRSNALNLKEKLEEITLKFELTSNIDSNGNLNVHGSVSTKDVDKKLKELGYNLSKHSLQKIHLISHGTHEVNVSLYKDIEAKLKIEINVTNVKK
ncbi:50S ribosomal protein L9 [Mycoplasmopsis cynos]|uniref:Large ribosomal subunit protein bL9 n=3 Tax=Mycoplasmopsis cynos TaxID=171284 RepID=L0RY18_MYCC1|nr:50S ribosomal protein L9 [Mycoplasmopsis cynos]MCU9932852.1 50S ribosomal protein L9 [Mycoplasmopsis cynos]TQC54587.1 50S ribosomal protein L9 [Mycoplasmopsis cynos]UWV77742.1 50S ribosomal protein L9 [Mycoplasmopsis cynos]UWV81395.1 50S ribosomal protein L9 [Mycoplasmopsis cynos]WAM07595.1 50S ribosomal protein L9 [Mycoplasmopsis cynos]